MVGDLYRIALIGSGGVGKSTLAFAYSNFLIKQEGLSCRVANLDPACRRLSYEPVFDIRKRYSLHKIMREHKLGPNGALKRIYLSLSGDARALRELNGADADWLLLDTAGSLELFLFEGTTSFLKKTADAVLFLVDNESVSSESDFVLLKAINAIQKMKYALPTLTVLNKSDLLESKKTQKRLALPEGGEGAVSAHLNELLKEIGKKERIVLVSAWERRGFRELSDALRELKCECGDLS